MVKGMISEEIQVKTAASEVWKIYGTLELKRIAEEQLRGFVQKIDVVQGDGGVGTLLTIIFEPAKMKSITGNLLFVNGGSSSGTPGFQNYTEKYTKVDDEKRVKEAEVVEGGYIDMGFTLYRVRFEVVEDGENRCITRSTIEYEAKGEAANIAPSIVTIQPLVSIMKGVAENVTAP